MSKPTGTLPEGTNEPKCATMTFDEWAETQAVEGIPDPILTDKQLRIAYRAWHARDAHIAELEDALAFARNALRDAAACLTIDNPNQGG